MKFKRILLTAYLFIWLYLSIDPWYREDWLLENLLIFIAFPIIIWANKQVAFSHIAVWMLFIFFLLHSIGAHYTYSEMPWFSPITELFGFERNHYDRLTHFLFGFLLFLPFYELFSSYVGSKRTALIITFFFLIAASGIYEVI
ncbi:MAG: putative rane protein, partial [Campylobacterota bacterium]|nr:putative rane protein [Campylobacterota bacterium]